MPRPQLLFVVGVGRSGTTALANIVASHSQVVLERYKRLCAPARIGELNRSLFDKDRFFDFSDGLTNLAPDRGSRWHEHYVDMAAKWTDARYVGDKMTRIQIARIWKNVPRAKFLCIVRDIREVASSWQARAADIGDASWAAEDDGWRSVARWNTANVRILRSLLNRPPFVSVVEYSSAFGSTDGRPLRRALDWLGLEWDPPIERAFRHAHLGYVRTVAGKNRSLPPDLEEFIEKSADRALFEFLVSRAL